MTEMCDILSHLYLKDIFKWLSLSVISPVWPECPAYKSEALE